MGKRKKNHVITIVLKLMCVSLILLLLSVDTLDTEAAAKKVSVVVNHKNAIIVKGNSIQLTASLKNASKKSVTYKSSNKKVASVTKAGTVKGIKSGSSTITITVKAKAGKKYTKKVKVIVKNKATSKTANITATGIKTLLKGNSSTLTPALKSSKSKVTSTSYKTSNKKVASVTNKGIVKGVKSGSATITITSKTKDKQTLVHKVKINVKNSKSSATSYISASPSSKTLQVGRTKTIAAILKNSKSKVSGCTFKSSNTGIATVSGAGKVTAKKAGAVTITITSKTKDKQVLVSTAKITVKSCTAHSYTKTTTQATCTTDGKIIETCKYCGSKKTSAVKATGHKASNWEIVKEATTTATGERVKKCTVCKAVVSRETIPKIAACSHNYVETSNTATCTASGKITENCTKCGDTLTYNTTKIDHKYVEKITPATCTSAGNKTSTCSMCGHGTGEQISPTGHKWSKTNNSDGSFNEKCSNSGCKEQHSNVKAYKIELPNGSAATIYGYYDTARSKELLNQTNSYRKSNNLSELTTDSTIQSWADTRAYESAYLFSHDRPNGSYFTSIFDKVVVTVGENLHGNINSASADTILSAWKGSTEHNNNMLKKTFYRAGVSVFVSRQESNRKVDYRLNAVQLFSYQ